MFTSLYFDLKSFAILYYIEIHLKRYQGWLCCANSSIDNDKLRLYYSIMDNDYDNLGLCWANTANDNEKLYFDWANTANNYDEFSLCCANMETIIKN